MEYFLKKEILQITLAITSLWELFEVIEDKANKKLKAKEENFKNSLIKHLNNKCREFREGFSCLLSQHKQWRRINKDKPIPLSNIYYFTFNLVKKDEIKKEILQFLAQKEDSLVTDFKEKFEIIKILEQQTEDINNKKDLQRLTGPIQIYNQRRFTDEIIFEILQDIIANVTLYAIDYNLAIKYKNGKTMLSLHVTKN